MEVEESGVGFLKRCFLFSGKSWWVGSSYTSVFVVVREGCTNISVVRGRDTNAVEGSFEIIAELNPDASSNVFFAIFVMRVIFLITNDVTRVTFIIGKTSIFLIFVYVCFQLDRFIVCKN